MRTPWIVRLALVFLLVAGGSTLAADPLVSVGGPAVEINVDTDAINTVLDHSADNAAKLMKAVADFICTVFACGGTGAPQPGGAGGTQPPPAQPESVLPIPDDWAKDPRYVSITGRLPITDATTWLESLRVVRSTFDGESFVVDFEAFAAGRGLSFVTFHRAYELPPIVRSANRLEGRYVVPAGSYRVTGSQLKIPVTRLR